MRPLYLLGWIFVFLACFGAVAESMAHAVPHTGGFFLSAYDVWYALSPGGLVVSKIRIEALLGPWAWDPVMTSLLVLPAWALFGVPGSVLVWLGWPRRRRDIDREADADADREAEALFLYDSLADQVEAEAREFAAFESSLADQPPPEDEAGGSVDSPKEKDRA